MSSRKLILWISLVRVIGVFFGVFYAFFGLNGLPVYKQLVSASVYTSWSNGLYGAIFIGFSVLLFFVGRHALKTKDKFLMKALLYGITSWLTVEALFSFYYGVYFNIGVDILLIVVLEYPLVMGLRVSK